MKKIFFLFSLSLFFQISVFAGPGDTIKVQAFTFGSPQDAWFEFPSSSIDFEKVLMLYKLKCNPAQSPACGEWDYLTYTYLYEHTGNLDSTLLYHSNYLVNGTSPDTFMYATEPTYSLLPTWNYSVVYDDTLSYSEYTIGHDPVVSTYPFHSSNPITNSQYLWKSEELLTAGLTAGNITGIQLNILSSGSSLQHISIKLKNSALTELSSSSFETSGFTEVFSSSSFTLTDGDFHFDFQTPFYWDGLSNIIIQISYDNFIPGINSETENTTQDFQSAIHFSSNDRFISFTNPTYANPIENTLDSLLNEVTVSFWAFGNPDKQPQNGTCFEAVTDDNVRVLNSHTPWSDQTIYWDAGNAGYDRINKTASAADYENNWTHWAFTKNAVSGEMKIYKNGLLWHSGTEKTKVMDEITSLIIGKGTWGGSQSYEGNMDEFAIWDVALDESTIQDYLYKDLDDAHPQAEHLIAYYQFNDGAGLYETDASENDALLAKIGSVTHLYQSENQFRNAVSSFDRINIKFEEASYVSHLDSTLIIDTIFNDALTLITFNSDDPTTGVDTLLVYPANYYVYQYNAEGEIIDSTFIASDETLYHEDYPYYSEPFEIINRYELARYITPYGIGLDLGEGFTWTYDLTDYLPLLHDSVHLSAGNWQELLDVQFLFIEGTPARKPLSVTNLWNGGLTYGLTPSYDDQTPDRIIDLPSEAKNSRVKVRVTGHGFGGNLNCSEFCSKEHYLFVDGIQKWSREVWRETCDINPVYPQGGTWVYDRANWCPGAEVETYDVELTPFVSPGTTVNLDYDAEEYTWNGGGSTPYYQTEVQLITYDEPNFSLNASLDEIITPSVNDMQSRKNPVCNNPVIRIKNNGTTPLTSLKIEFGIKDFDKAYFNWEGNLDFLESEEITLPDFPWTNSASVFEVTISEPNSGADEYSFDNHAESKMQIPETFASDFIIELKTNKKPNQTELFVYDALGNTILERTSFDELTVYKDTLHLADGCYELYLWDSGENGLDFWAAPADGIGYCKLKTVDPPSYFKVYEPDFGGLIYQQFIVGNYVDINDEIILNKALSIFPNPANEEVFAHIKNENLIDTKLQLINAQGQVLDTKILPPGAEFTTHFDCKQYAPGLYFISAENTSGTITKPFMISK